MNVNDIDVEPLYHFEHHSHMLLHPLVTGL